MSTAQSSRYILFFISILPVIIALPAYGASSGSVNDVYTGASYTHISADGNRYTRLTATLPRTDAIEVQLDGTPLWVLGHGGIWIVVLSDGRVNGYRVDHDSVQPVKLEISIKDAASPPILLMRNAMPKVVSTGLTSPMYLDGVMASLNAGRLFIEDKEVARDLLRDSRILADGQGAFMALSSPTDEYRHGALGDTIEARGVVVASIERGRHDVIEELPPGTVIEGTAPIWSDINGDEVREIILTLSDSSSGASYAVYDMGGRPVARSKPVGKANRWQHQIAIAPFGPDGELELVGVRTPHLNASLEYYRMTKDKLALVARLEGYSSHQNGSRNLDMAVAGDFDSDGTVEVLVPVIGHGALAGIERTQDGVRRDWLIELNGRLSTNIAIAENDGMAAVGAGTTKGILYIWLPSR